MEMIVRTVSDIVPMIKSPPVSRVALRRGCYEQYKTWKVTTMAIAWHLTFGMYGFWLPNDPRGSWSDYVFAKHLYAFGGAAKVNTRHSRAYDTHDHQKRLEAKKHLQFPPVQLTGDQALIVSSGFKQVVMDTGLVIHACAIMPDHVHLVLGQHQRKVESLVNQLKSCATKQLTIAGKHPLDGQRSPWSRGYWLVYLDTPDNVQTAIQYVRNNPVRDGFREQNWSFVVPFE
jgi:REP element-mobilizing transposase RayT